MEPHTIIGLGFLGLFVWMAYKLFSKTKSKTQNTTTSPQTPSAALAKFQSLLKNTPPSPAAQAAAVKAQTPSRDDAIQAIFTLVDFASAHELPDVAKLISDQLPAIALKKGE